MNNTAVQDSGEKRPKSKPNVNATFEKLCEQFPFAPNGDWMSQQKNAQELVDKPFLIDDKTPHLPSEECQQNHPKHQITPNEQKAPDRPCQYPIF